jgi:hypothetical protein
MRFLLKYATKARPELFKSTLKAWVDKLSGLHEVHFIISIDDDDESMQAGDIFQALADACEHERVTLSLYTGQQATKIEAINRDMDKAGDFDILICVSDDMVPLVDYYDDRIASDMKSSFPDFDGCLHYSDGSTHHALITLSIMGKKMYDSFGYIYYPGYKSLWCDNEFMDQVKRMDKYVYSEDVIIEHQWKRHGDDITYKRSEADYSRDRALYDQRREAGFPE